MIAAVQERMLQVAGEVCEGVRLHGIVTRQYIDQIAIPNLKKGFDKSGRPAAEWNDFQIGGGGFLCVAPDQDSLARAVRENEIDDRVLRIDASYRSELRNRRMGRYAEELHQLSVQQKWTEMAKQVTDEMVHAFAAVGTYADIARVIKKRFAGVNRLIFDMPVKNDHDRGMLKEIIQDLRRPLARLT